MSQNRNNGLRAIAKIRCRELRKNSTNAEKIFWEYVRNRKFLGLKINRQFPIFVDVLGKETFYIADFYCHEKSLVIELDGVIHKYKTNEDNLRTEIINTKGLKVVRFTNEEVEMSLLNVLEKLENIITLPQTPSLKNEGAIKSPSLLKRRI